MGFKKSGTDVKQRLWEMADGSVVSDDVLGIVHKIQSYDPNLSIQYLDPDQADFVSAPYRVMELCPDGALRVVMEVWELDDRLFQSIVKADTQKFKVLEGMDNRNHMKMLGIKQRYRDETAALSEMVADILRSHKDTYTATNPVTGQKHTFRSLPHSKD